MKLGVVTHMIADGIRPTEIARELETRGFESMWVGEHTHIPVAQDTLSPRGPTPIAYIHMMSALTALTSAAAVTDRLVVGTAISLLLQHDLIDYALQTATLDRLSNGRLRLGIGVGWNEEELANHRPDLPFKQRFSAMRERVQALRTIWGEEVAQFEGRWDKITPSWVNPKPVSGAVPILMGGWTPLAMGHAAEYGDEWMPIDGMLTNDDGKPDAAAGIAKFRRIAEERGRDPLSIPINLLLFSPPTIASIEGYAKLGVQRVLMPQPSNQLLSRDEALRHLDSLTPIATHFA